MLDWWTANLKTFSSVGLLRSDFRGIIDKSNLALRRGINELLAFTRDHDVPFIVVSAGI